jgi:hypothetical protein
MKKVLGKVHEMPPSTLLTFFSSYFFFYFVTQKVNVTEVALERKNCQWRERERFQKSCSEREFFHLHKT